MKIPISIGTRNSDPQKVAKVKNRSTFVECKWWLIQQKDTSFGKHNETMPVIRNQIRNKM